MRDAKTSAAAVDQAAIDRVLAGLASDRAVWVVLGKPGSGRRVRFKRPEEADLPSFMGGAKIEHVCKYVDAWEGFTEATFLGESVGASDPLPFALELWTAWARDNMEEAGQVATAMAGAISARLEARSNAAKN